MCENSLVGELKRMEKGDLVYPSKGNLHHFNKNTKFPWRIHRIEGLTLWLERKSIGGRKVIEKWHISFWQTEVA